jgi:hypothetical protein
MWKEAVVASFKVIFRHLAGGALGELIYVFMPLFTIKTNGMFGSKIG